MVKKKNSTPKKNTHEPISLVTIATIFIILLIIGVSAWILLINQKTITQPIACTEEAKLCPDGSSVGRTGPNCEFTPCPTLQPGSPTITSYIEGGNEIIEEEPPINDYGPASDGCIVGGCSGELCLNEDNEGVFSPCIYREEFSCLKLSMCEKQADGNCGWTQTDAYLGCMTNYEK